MGYEHWVKDEVISLVEINIKENLNIGVARGLAIADKIIENGKFKNI